VIYTVLHIAPSLRPPCHDAVCVGNRRGRIVSMRIDMEIYAAVFGYAWCVILLHSTLVNYQIHLTNWYRYMNRRGNESGHGNSKHMYKPLHQKENQSRRLILEVLKLYSFIQKRDWLGNIEEGQILDGPIGGLEVGISSGQEVMGGEGVVLSDVPEGGLWQQSLEE